MDVPGSDGVKIKQVGNPIKFSQSVNEYRRVGLSAAEADTNEVLKNLGYTQAEIDDFAKSGLFS